MLKNARRMGLCAALLVASLTSAVNADDCDMVTPQFIDDGMLQQFSIRCDLPFIGFIQVAASSTFSPSFNFPIRASKKIGDDHYVTISLRVPWNIENIASEFWFRGLALDANGGTHLAGPAPVPVGIGDRVYLNAAPDAGKNLFVIEMEFEENTESWDELTVESDYTSLGYYYWSGSDHFTNDTHGRIVYRFKVEAAGRYALAFRSGHFGGHLNNDCWCAWDDDDSVKVLCGQDGFWRWQTTEENGGGFKKDLSVGVHTLTFAARSNEFSLDRFHIFRLEDYSRGEIEDETLTASGHEYQ